MPATSDFGNNSQIRGSVTISKDEHSQLLKLQTTQLASTSIASQTDTSIACTSSSPTWIFDSGASDHMTGMQYVFSSFNPSVHPGVTLANGSCVPVSGSGSVNIFANLSLPSVLHVPSLPFNLMSVSKLTKQLNCSVTFFSDSVVVQDLKTRRMIEKGYEAHGLYYLSSTNQLPA